MSVWYLIWFQSILRKNGHCLISSKPDVWPMRLSDSVQNLLIVCEKTTLYPLFLCAKWLNLKKTRTLQPNMQMQNWKRIFEYFKNRIEWSWPLLLRLIWASRAGRWESAANSPLFCMSLGVFPSRKEGSLRWKKIGNSQESVLIYTQALFNQDSVKNFKSTHKKTEELRRVLSTATNSN